MAITLIISSCKNDKPDTTQFVDPAITEIYNEYYSYRLIKNPKLKMFFQNPDWNKVKSWKSGDTILYHFPFSTGLMINQVLSVKSFNGRKQFDIQVQNPNSRLAGEDTDVRHINFPVHPEMAKGRILAGGHNCGSCHNYAWWDTFDEVTITASAPTNNDPYVPDRG